MRSIDMKDVFQTLFAIAWADGELRDEEKEFLAELVHRSEAGVEASRWFEQPPQEPDWQQFRDDKETAEALLRHAAYMAATDATVQYQELTLLERLRDQLGMPESDFHRILREVEEDRV